MSRALKGNIVFYIAFVIILSVLWAASRASERADARKRLEYMLTDAGVAIVFSDRDGDITAWKGASETVFGYPKEAATLLTVHDLVPPDRRVAHRIRFEERMANPSGHSHRVFSEEGLHADGSRIVLDGIVFADGDGAVGLFAPASAIKEF